MKNIVAALEVLTQLKTANEASAAIDKIMDGIKKLPASEPKSKIKEVTYKDNVNHYRFTIDGPNKTTFYLNGHEHAKLIMDATNSYAVASYIWHEYEAHYGKTGKIAASDAQTSALILCKKMEKDLEKLVGRIKEGSYGTSESVLGGIVEDAQKLQKLLEQASSEKSGASDTGKAEYATPSQAAEIEKFFKIAEHEVTPIPDGGTSILGNGISVLVLEPRKRNATWRKVYYQHWTQGEQYQALNKMIEMAQRKFPELAHCIRYDAGNMD